MDAMDAMDAMRPPILRGWPVRVVLGLLIGAFSTASAMFAMPIDAPVGRLLSNAGKYVQEHPDDAQGHYVLGRINALAFILKSRVVDVWDEKRTGRWGDEPKKDLPEVASDHFQFGATEWARANPDQRLTRQELLKHLAEAVRGLVRAVDLDGTPAHYHLGLAHVLEEGAMFAGEVEVLPGLKEVPEKRRDEIGVMIDQLGAPSEKERQKATSALRECLAEAVSVLVERRDDVNPNIRAAVRALLSEHWRKRASAEYYAAYEGAIDQALSIKEKPMRGLQTLVGYEAANGFVRMVKPRGPRDDRERGQLAKVESDLQTLNNKPDNMAITPIVFDLERLAPLSDLEDPHLRVKFRLDGTGREQSWSWVKPTTGILVWDPTGAGRITSGQQLFGSATWWMFFSDGYHALDALDDNRDGRLSGGELRGLAVWFDRNSDGVSDKGEVVTVESAGIDSIATAATTREGDAPANHEGLELKDGRVLPTYDWISHGSARDPKPVSHTPR